MKNLTVAMKTKTKTKVVNIIRTVLTRTILQQIMLLCIMIATMIYGAKVTVRTHIITLILLRSTPKATRIALVTCPIRTLVMLTNCIMLAIIVSMLLQTRRRWKDLVREFVVS
jgi:hypothetical protein